MQYKKAMERIDSIIKDLDSNTELEYAIELFNESLTLTGKCVEALSEAKGKITEISKKLNELIESDLDIKEKQ